MGQWPIFRFENKRLGFLVIVEELEKLLEPTIERLGYELSDLEMKLGGKGGFVRIFIDHPDGVGLDDCETVSRAVSITAIGNSCGSPSTSTTIFSSPDATRVPRNRLRPSIGKRI